MLSYKDFEQKQIVFISSEELKNLTLKNENLAVSLDWKITNQLSVHKIFCVFVSWDCTISTKLVNKILEFWISMYFMNINLKPKFCIWWQLEWNFLLREKQYNNKWDFDIAKIIVKNKAINQLELLKKIRNKTDKLKYAIDTIKNHIINIDKCEQDESLRWIEWNISKLYFPMVFKEIWWYKRMPRTRIDVLNLMLDIWYTYLYNIFEANLNLYWFDIYKWVYHKQFYERKSLVCDLIEPFRCLIEDQIVKWYNLWQIKEKDFFFKNWEYNIKHVKRPYYMKLMLDPIMKNKESIFNYVKNYYRAIIKNDISLIDSFSI